MVSRLFGHMGRVGLNERHGSIASYDLHRLYIYLEYGLRWPLTGGELYYVSQSLSLHAIHDDS